MNARMALLMLTGALTPWHAFLATGQAAAPCPYPASANPPALHALGKLCTVTPWSPADDCPPGCGSPCTVRPCLSSCCPCACCPPSSGCGMGLELDAAFLLWWVKSAPTPPLASTSAPADLGVLGTATGSVVLGGPTSVNPVIGGRLAGRFLANEALGVQLGGFLLENGTSSKAAFGLPVLAVPFIDPADGANAAVVLTAPGSADGAVVVRFASRLWGADASALARANLSDGVDLDLLAGFRYLSLAESLLLQTTTTTAVPGFFNGTDTPAGSTYIGFDRFGTRNSFYGGQLGGRAVANFGSFTVQATASVALGSTHQTVNVSGATRLLAPGVALAVAPGNVFAQQTNIGSISRDRFGVVPQAGLAVGYQVYEFARLTVGYDFLYWSNVARPGGQIDRTVNPNLPPILDTGVRGGEARPAQLLVGSDYWAQGLTFGLELSF